jgi:hypothetical protein
VAHLSVCFYLQKKKKENEKDCKKKIQPMGGSVNVRTSRVRKDAGRIHPSQTRPDQQRLNDE